MTSVRQAVRKGFTLVELLLVITIILLISTLFLGLSTGDGGGLPAGQRFLASSIRTARAMALMNRGPGTTGVTYNGRYRLLILNDPNDEANHLRQFVIAVGGVGSADPALGGADPATVNDTSIAPYRWFSPEPPQLLPTGVVFVPPASDTSTTMELAVAANTRRSLIGQLADQIGSNPKDSPASSSSPSAASVRRIRPSLIATPQRSPIPRIRLTPGSRRSLLSCCRPASFSCRRLPTPAPPWNSPWRPIPGAV